MKASWIVHEDLRAAVERLNAGEPIAPVEAILVERVWELASSVAARQHSIGFDFGAMAGSDARFAPLHPDRRIAITARYQLLDTLSKCGFIDSYVEDAELRKKVFAAVASLPCNKNDLGEAFWLRRLQELSPDLAQKARDEARQAGYDPDHPQLGARLNAWMHDQC
jgi:hypothetical protein